MYLFKLSGLLLSFYYGTFSLALLKVLKVVVSLPSCLQHFSPQLLSVHSIFISFLGKNPKYNPWWHWTRNSSHCTCFLCNMCPAKLPKVLDVPQVVMVEAIFFAAHDIVVEYHGNLLGHPFVHKLHPSLGVALLLVAAKLLAPLSNRWICKIHYLIHLTEIWLIGISGSDQDFYLHCYDWQVAVITIGYRWEILKSLPEIPINRIPINWIRL